MATLLEDGSLDTPMRRALRALCVDRQQREEKRRDWRARDLAELDAFNEANGSDFCLAEWREMV